MEYGGSYPITQTLGRGMRVAMFTTERLGDREDEGMRRSCPQCEGRLIVRAVVVQGGRKFLWWKCISPDCGCSRLTSEPFVRDSAPQGGLPHGAANTSQC